LVLVFFSPGLEFRRGLFPFRLQADQLFHIPRRDNEGGGAAVPGDRDGLALDQIEELSELVLGFG
jgi:hypothetical protein